MGRARFLFALLGLSAFASCASAPKPGEFTDRELLEAACPPAFASTEAPKVVRGSVWAKIDSPELKGQFPATVLVVYPRKLALEVTNLIGSPQAWLQMTEGRTELRFSAENQKKFGDTAPEDRLGGLPLELAPRLFAGGVPCPSGSKNVDLRMKPTEEGGLEVIELDLRSRDQTRFVYTFGRYAGRPWVSAIEWEKLAKAGTRSAKSEVIRILREEPSDPDGAPKRWSASSERGEIRVRWKDRVVGSP